MDAPRSVYPLKNWTRPTGLVKPRDILTGYNLITDVERSNVSNLVLFGREIYRTATSDTKTPTSDNSWLQMANNSITLTSGSWMISGAVDFGNDTSNAPQYTQIRAVISETNGDDTAGGPTAITADAGYPGATLYDFHDNYHNVFSIYVPIATFRYTCTSTKTLYIVPNVFTTEGPGVEGYAHARVKAYLYAQKILGL